MFETSARIAATALSSLTLAAGAAHADRVAGSVDGEAREWHVLDGPDGKTANWSVLPGGAQAVTIQAHRQDRFETQGSVSLTLHLFDGAVMAAEAIYFPENGMLPHYSVQDAAGGLEIEALDLEAAPPRVAGRFEADLAYQESMFSEPDEARALSLVLEFDVAPSPEP
jgi:hypothetical protein